MRGSVGFVHCSNVYFKVTLRKPKSVLVTVRFGRQTDSRSKQARDLARADEALAI